MGFFLYMSHEKLSKPVVLYLASDGGKKKCGRCMMFLTDVGKCSVHGSGINITGDMVCGFYIHGKPMTSKDHPPMKLVTPAESGLIGTNDGGTHCASCIHFSPTGSACEIVEGYIEPNGCCNHWENPTIELNYADSNSTKKDKLARLRDDYAGVK